MKRTIIRHTGIAATVLALSVSLAACGGGDDESADSGGSDTSSQSDDSSTSSGGSGEESGAAEDAGAEAFGPGCSAIPTEGAGSFGGMATEPVATAASANPLLKTLVAAVGEAGLVDTLNSAPELTVFAPTDDAFAKIPKKAMGQVMADKPTLTKILSHHVVEGKLDPEQVKGKHKTLAGDTINIKGSGEEYTVGKENAAVLCGNIPTANATVYVIDTVMMP